MGAVNPYTFRLDTSATNLAATFTTVPQIGSPTYVVGPPTAIVMVQVNNPSTSELEVNCSAATTPSANQQGSFYVPASTAYQTPYTSAVQLPLGKYCWVRSYTGTISTGIIEIVAWGY